MKSMENAAKIIRNTEFTEITDCALIKMMFNASEEDF